VSGGNEFVEVQLCGEDNMGKTLPELYNSMPFRLQEVIDKGGKCINA